MVKVFEIWLMFTILRYKIFFKIIVLKYSIKSFFNYFKLSNAISKDKGINPKGN